MKTGAYWSSWSWLYEVNELHLETILSYFLFMLSTITFQRLIPKLTQNIQQGHLRRISHFCWRKHNGLKICALSVWTICHQSLLFENFCRDFGWVIPLLCLWDIALRVALLPCCAALWGSITMTQRSEQCDCDLPGAAGDSSITSVEVPGFSLSLQKGLSPLLHQWQLQWQQHLQILWWFTKQIWAFASGDRYCVYLEDVDVVQRSWVEWQKV